MPEKPAVAPSIERGERATLVGVVTSAKMAKTLTVSVERFVRHPKFGKFLKRYTTCYAHDEKGEGRSGDRVEIVSTRPLSRLKRWRLVRVVEKAPIEDLPVEAAPAKKPAAAAKGAAKPAAPKAADKKKAAPKG